MPRDLIVNRTLLDSAKRGDERALERLYDAYAESVYRAAFSLLRSPAATEDVVHDLFADLPRLLERYEGRGTLEGWLRTCGVRLALMVLRRNGREKRWSENGGAPRTGDHGDRVLARVDLERAVDELPESLRAVLILREVGGYSHEEISGELGISVSNSMVRLHRARARLRSLLGGGGER